MTRFDRAGAEEFLRARGAAAIPHPGGTLLAHLGRVADVLRQWGAEPDVQAAGLCHAAYGTDGFATALITPAERATLAAVIGARAEALVYLYGSAVRAAVYPRLGDPAPVRFLDRFTGDENPAPEWQVRAFAELTAANELDVLARDAEIAAEHGPALTRLFARVRDRLSPPARAACDELAQRVSRPL
jgi:hypothetical protein